MRPIESRMWWHLSQEEGDDKFCWQIKDPKGGAYVGPCGKNSIELHWRTDSSRDRVLSSPTTLGKSRALF